MAAGGGLGEVSRPEALATGPREIAMPALGMATLAGKREPVRDTAALKPPATRVAEAERQRLLKTFAAGRGWAGMMRLRPSSPQGRTHGR